MKAASIRERCRRLRVVVTDVDGVLTDGGMYYGESGEELKKFNIRDGAGVALLKSAGLMVGAMTGESRALVNRRMEKMGVEPAFFLKCELVDVNGPRDVTVDYLDRTPRKPGDYYYVRIEQLDTNKAWSSPVWMN